MVDAPRGEVWLDEEIAKRVESRFDVEQEGEFEFKGFSAKEKVFVLYERKEESESFFEGGLLGREEELKILETFIQPIFENQYAGNLVVTGEAGIGKSHLLKGLEDSELAKDSLWLSCQTNQILISSLNPFTYILKKYFGTSDSQGENRNKRNFNRKLNNLIDSCADPELADELDRTQSFLGALLGLKWPDSLYEQLEPKSRLENSFLALIAFFQTLSLEQPLVLLVEDVHWLDSDSKTFLLRLQRVLNSSEESFAIAVLLTARPTENALPEALNYEILELNELNLTNIQSLITNSLGNASEELINLVFERSQGNPFFAEQIIRYLQEENQVDLKDDIWQLSPNQKKKALPLDVRSVLIARIDRLSQDIKELVQTASILGREFEVQLLSQIMQSDDLSLKLNEAEKAAVWTSLSELRYLFKHALLRDAAYDMQLVSRRKALHKLSVEALENVYKHDLENHYAELAYHSEQAQLTEKAKRYLELAGDSAKDAYQNEQAIDFFSRALALSSKNDQRSQFELKLKRESVYGLLGQRNVQLVELEDLEELANGLDKDALIRVLLRKADYFYWRSFYDKVIQIANQVIEFCNTEDDLLFLFKSHILLARAYGFYDNGSERSKVKTHTMLAVSYAEQLKDDEIIAESLLWLGYSNRYHNDEKAKHYFEEALVATKNILTKSSLYNRLGSIARREKDFDKAKEHYQEALKLTRKTGSRRAYGLTLYSFALLHNDMHDYDQAEDFFLQAARVGDEIDSKLADDGVWLAAAMVANKGQLKNAQRRLIEVYKNRFDKGAASNLFVLNFIAITAKRLGDLQQAEDYTKQYLEALRQRFSYDEIHARIDLGMIYFELSKLQASTEELLKAQALLGKPEQLETFASATIENLDLLEAAVKVGLASIALEQQHKENAHELMDEAVKILAKYETLSYLVDDFNYPYSQLFYQAYIVLKALNRPEASQVLDEAYKRIMELSQKIGKTEEAQKQVWIEDRFRLGIVEAWQAENL